MNVASLVETLMASCAVKKMTSKKNQEAIKLKALRNEEDDGASVVKPKDVSIFLTVSSKSTLFVVEK